MQLLCSYAGMPFSTKHCGFSCSWAVTISESSAPTGDCLCTAMAQRPAVKDGLRQGLIPNRTLHLGQVLHKAVLMALRRTTACRDTGSGIARSVQFSDVMN